MRSSAGRILLRFQTEQDEELEQDGGQYTRRHVDIDPHRGVGTSSFKLYEMELTRGYGRYRGWQRSLRGNVT